MSDKKIALVTCALVVLALGVASQLFAGDAVAIGYNAEGVWSAGHLLFFNAKGGRITTERKLVKLRSATSDDAVNTEWAGEVLSRRFTVCPSRDEWV